MPVPVEPLDLVEKEVAGLVDLVGLDLEGEEVVGLMDQTAQRGKKEVLVQTQEGAWDLTAGRLLQTLLGEGTMHSQKGE